MGYIYATTEERLAAKKARSAAEYLRNKEKYLVRNAAWRIKNPARALLMSARGRAKRAGLPFDLTIEDVVIPDVCPVLGIPLVQNHDGSRAPAHGSPTIDKFIPERGYVKGNVAIVSHLANTIKNAASPTQVQAVATWMKANVPE